MVLKRIPASSETIEFVRLRLEFIGIITSLNPQFVNPALIRLTLNGGWTHPWQQFHALRTYLLLTCFDVLGQPADFKDFQSWLAAKSTEQVRNAAATRAAAAPTFIESVRAFHREYLQIYGTKSAFYRFLNDLLPSGVRQELLYSIQIRRIDRARNLEVEVVQSMNDKWRFLFDLRNSYTHAALAAGTPSGGLILNGGDGVMEIDGVRRIGWVPIYRDGLERPIFREYSVRNWPTVLIDAVEAGIAVIESGQLPHQPPSGAQG